MVDFQENSFGSTGRGKEPPNPALFKSAQIVSLIAGGVRPPTPEEELKARLGEELKKLDAEKVAFHAASESFTAALAEISRLKEEFYRGAEKEIADMALHLAEHIVGTELATNPEVVAKSVQMLISQAVEGERLSLTLSVSDNAFLKDKKPEWLASIEAIKGLSVKIDEKVPRGTCRLDTESLRLDGSLAKRIEFLWNELTGGLPASETKGEPSP